MGMHVPRRRYSFARKMGEFDSRHLHSMSNINYPKIIDPECVVHSKETYMTLCSCTIIPLRCSVCGISEDDEPNNLLTDCTIVIADGEEGFASITQFWCGDCLELKITELTNIGFKDHRHGGINYLEDPDCVDCLSPSEYGNYVVQ